MITETSMPLSDWTKYRDLLGRINEKAADEFRDAVWNIHGKWHGAGLGAIPREELVEYAYGLATKYGEASAAAAAEMYDAAAFAQKAGVPAAVPAQTATYPEVSRTVNGIMVRTQSEEVLAQAIGRLVKLAGQDTILENAYRDRAPMASTARRSKRSYKGRHTGAEVAWVPSGDTCPYCIMLASAGWRKQTNWGEAHHAEHVHANCDCSYMVRFNKNFNVEGYDPDEYREEYKDAEGSTQEEKINSMRRMQYQDPQTREKINAQKREAYADRKDEQKRIEAASPFKNPDGPLEIDAYSQSKHFVGGEGYVEYMKDHEYQPSYLTISMQEAQELVDKYHGTGILKLGRDGSVLPSEMIVDNDKIIGYAVNNTNGKTVETSGFKIHYSKSGTHIVPMYQNQKEYWKEKRERNGHDWLLRQKS